MAHRKAGGSAKNLTDSGPQYLGTKLYAGEVAKAGSIIVRQRGTKILAGANVPSAKTTHSTLSKMESLSSQRRTSKTLTVQKLAVK